METLLFQGYRTESRFIITQGYSGKDWVIPPYPTNVAIFRARINQNTMLIDIILGLEAYNQMIPNASVREIVMKSPQAYLSGLEV